ncbi:HAD-IA family hydrolase [Rubrivivax rivuli]|uniref:HAD family hydrolase n=1 Tax=Rubrivivax rivuli TaxID=1862385 RepID=A0A437RII1_9BURK|nr:HAD-IA family hydrolase [Rubrivivax rivuli]RVU46573.1 HAD family hydrolase [Rubrivivax rivuli]
MPAHLQAVLFDLDGTLVDSAPDLAGTANDMLSMRGRPALPYEALRCHAGSGARGMLGAAFGMTPNAPGYGELRDEFHTLYAARLLRQTRCFEATQRMLGALDERRIVWGIVTNKALRFAEPLVQALGLARSAALVAGDSTPHTKPHPAPLLEAAKRLAVPPAACVYVGDDERDVIAGSAAGMRTLAAAWGYLGAGHDPHTWGADAVLPDADALLQWLELA